MQDILTIGFELVATFGVLYVGIGFLHFVQVHEHPPGSPAEESSSEEPAPRQGSNGSEVTDANDVAGIEGLHEEAQADVAKRATSRYLARMMVDELVDLNRALGRASGPRRKPRGFAS